MAIATSSLQLLLIFLFLAPKLLLATNTCHGEEFGSGINPDDCIKVIRQFQTQNIGMNPESEYAFIRRFASHLAAQFTKPCSLPQGFSWQTCSIGLDKSDDDDGMVIARWSDIYRHLYGLVDSCVNGKGDGGIGNSLGFEYAITNPSIGLAMDQFLEGQTRGTSLVSHLWLKAHVRLGKDWPLLPTRAPI